jgi:hypothetical protein
MTIAARYRGRKLMKVYRISSYNPVSAVNIANREKALQGIRDRYHLNVELEHDNHSSLYRLRFPDKGTISVHALNESDAIRKINEELK